MQFGLHRAEVAADESWAQAADRRVDQLDLIGPVLAGDLSADPLVFRADAEHRFSVRPMTLGDLPVLGDWIRTEHVARWWNESGTADQVDRDYGAGIRGEDPTRHWIWEINGRSVGFSQDYRVSDHPEYALLCARPDAVGFDYAIGEPAFVGRGLGTALLWVYLRDIVWPAYPGVSEFFAAPDHRNAASLRLLAKLGFRQGLWFDEPQRDGRVDTVIGCSLDVAQVMGINEPGVSTS